MIDDIFWSVRCTPPDASHRHTRGRLIGQLADFKQSVERLKRQVSLAPSTDDIEMLKELVFERTKKLKVTNEAAVADAASSRSWSRSWRGESSSAGARGMDHDTPRAARESVVVAWLGARPTIAEPRAADAHASPRFVPRASRVRASASPRGRGASGRGRARRRASRQPGALRRVDSEAHLAECQAAMERKFDVRLKTHLEGFEGWQKNMMEVTSGRMQLLEDSQHDHARELDEVTHHMTHHMTHYLHRAMHHLTNPMTCHLTNRVTNHDATMATDARSVRASSSSPPSRLLASR